jgi:hypothetical protein
VNEDSDQDRPTTNKAATESKSTGGKPRRAPGA